MKKKCTYLQGIKRSDETPPGEHLHLDISSGSDLLWSLLRTGHYLRQGGLEEFTWNFMIFLMPTLYIECFLFSPPFAMSYIHVTPLSLQCTDLYTYLIL